MTPELALALRNAEIERFYNDEQFQYILAHNLWQYDAESLEGHNLRREVRSATAVGVLRAWMGRFFKESGHSVPFSRGRDINEDYGTTLAVHPAFAVFVPATPLTTREVLLAARMEVNHAILLYERRWSPELGWTVREQYKERPENSPVIGPVALRIASRLLCEVGFTDTVLWIFSRCIFDGETTATGRGLCGIPSHTEYRRLHRKLAALDLVVQEYSNDSLLREAAREAV